MKEKKSGILIYVLLIIIAAILLIVFGVCIYLAVKKEDFGIINYVSITSSFSVALLTVIYVYASTKQMHVMTLQLEEMKTEHLLKNQPILILNQPEFTIEIPKFFYCPPENRFSFQSRYFFEATLVNASDDPGITVSVVARIVIPKNENEVVIRTFNERFSISSSKDGPNKVSFLFNGDLNCDLFDAMRERKAIKVETVVYFKNTLGACFSTSNTYRFDIWDFGARSRETYDDSCIGKPNDPLSVIRGWHTAIVQAPTKYKESLKHLKKLVREEKQREEYATAFDEVKADFLSMYDTKNDLKCQPYEDNDTFELKTISKEEFEKDTDNSTYLQEIFSAANNK